MSINFYPNINYQFNQKMKHDLKNYTIDKTLNRLHHYGQFGGIMTLKEMLEKKAVKVMEEVIPKYQFNRRKFNQMYGYEQEIYEKKLKETKTAYYAYVTDTISFEIPKTAYEYYKTNISK